MSASYIGSDEGSTSLVDTSTLAERWYDCPTLSVVLAHYRLEHKLGEGSMAVVWAATDERTGERVAMKCLKPGVVSVDAKRRLKREARAITAIAHPNIIRVREVVTSDDGAPSIVMDLLEGEALRALLNRVGRLSLAETCDIMLPVMSAVGSAHARGIVHRDLKPDNIYLVGDGPRLGVRVLDFGIAKVLVDNDGSSSGALTSTGVLVGTPYYMAPEQVFGQKDLDARVDVWAIGVVLFECLVGRRPVEGKNAGRVLRAITMGNIERLAKAGTDFPKPVTSLVDRMLAPNRDDRPGDLTELHDVLKEAAFGRVRGGT